MKIDTYLEVGTKRTFASAAEWPGWSRSGPDEASALRALLDYGPRYAAVVRPARPGFQPPADISAFEVVERLKGDATTDFGAPGSIAASEEASVDEAALRRLGSLLKACWRLFDETVAAAKGRTLRSGPRGGGRDLEKMLSHVLEAQHAYVSRLGWKSALGAAADSSGPAKQPRKARRSENNEDQWQDALRALAAAAHGDLPASGPRGGLYWPPRYFVRRAAWHVLDHAWEIQDRLG